MNKFILCLISYFLLGCGEKEEQLTLAEAFAVKLIITENDQDSSVFISSLDLNMDTTDISSVSFTISPKEGALAEAIHTKFNIDKLETFANGVTLPIWGMYDNFDNTVYVTLYFTDYSEKVFSYNVNTDKYVDTESIYDQMQINRIVDATNKPSYSYFYLEASSKQGPVIVDIDGHVRWTANTPRTASTAITFDNGSFIIRSGSTIINLSLSGEESIYTIVAPGLTDIVEHHEFTIGKYGYFSNINATKNGRSILESILLEINNEGGVIGQWDLGEIIANYMHEKSDDPTTLIRDGIDWFHMNSAIYDTSDDSIIVSSRELFVIKIDYSTKKIKWILGDETKYWADFPSLLALSLDSSDVKPMGQHALSITNGQLMMFNNGQKSFNQPDGEEVGEVLTSSLAMKWSIDEENMEATNTWTYDAGLYSDVCSSIYEKNGSYLITYSAVNRKTALTNKIIIQGVDEERNVIFEFEYQGTCEPWNSDIINLESLVY